MENLTAARSMESEFLPSLLVRSPGNAIPYIALTSLALIAGLVGNTGVCITYCFSKNLPKPGREFLINMSLADLVVTLLANPLCLVGVIVGEEYLGTRPNLCIFVASVCLTSCFCAFFSLAGLCFSRYIFVCHNDLYPKIFRPGVCILLCIGFWIAGALFEAYNFVGDDGHHFDRKANNCIWNRLNSYTYTVLVGVLLIASPLVLMSAAYIRIIMVILRSKRLVSQDYTTTKSSSTSHTPLEAEEQLPPNLRKEKKQSYFKATVKSSWSVLVVLIMFIICWTPYTVVIIADAGDVFSLEVHLWTTWLAHLHSALNFYIYLLTNSKFRQCVFKTSITGAHCYFSCLTRQNTVSSDADKPETSTKVDVYRARAHIEPNSRVTTLADSKPLESRGPYIIDQPLKSEHAPQGF